MLQCEDGLEPFEDSMNMVFLVLEEEQLGEEEEEEDLDLFCALRH